MRFEYRFGDFCLTKRRDQTSDVLQNSGIRLGLHLSSLVHAKRDVSIPVREQGRGEGLSCALLGFGTGTWGSQKVVNMKVIQYRAKEPVTGKRP